MDEEARTITDQATVMMPLLPTLGVALIYAAVAIWYWIRLGRGSVPRSRRTCRRWGLAFGGFAVAGMVFGTSLIESDRSPVAFIAAWSVVGLSVLAVTISAAIDVLLTSLLYRESLQRHIIRDAQQLRHAIVDREDSDEG